MRGKTGADREISVNTYTGGFTTMLNHHLRNRNLSLKAVGLLSKMLSLPPDWDYSIRGLAMLNTDGIDGIRTAMKELEDEGYVVRVQSRDERGRMSRNKYTVYALPQKEKPSPDLPSSENPTTVKPPPDEPMTEKPTQINTNQVIPKKRNDSLSKYQSINPDGMDAMDERERYEEIIRENLEVDILSQDSRYDIDRMNEIIEVMLDAICSTSPTLRVNNADMPKEVIKSRLLKLNSSHIDYVFDAMRKSPSDIRNIRAYMLTALYNAPATIDNYDACDREKFTIYENYREGKLTPEEYLSGKDALAQKQAALKEQLESCETQLEVFHQQSLDAEEQHEAASRMTGLPDDKLREHLYDAVERVLVYDTETIEIVWKFNESKIDTDENIGVAN